MPQPAHFRINSPTVIGEVIDGEAVIVNLDSGAYYSLRDSGGVIWRLIERGTPLPQLIDHMAAQYDAPISEIETGVNRLIAELQDEALIVPADVASTPSAATELANGHPLPFQEPVLEKFTDMADLLLLDPIHEVDEASGWPRQA